MSIATPTVGRLSELVGDSCLLCLLSLPEPAVAILPDFAHFRHHVLILAANVHISWHLTDAESAGSVGFSTIDLKLLQMCNPSVSAAHCQLCERRSL